MKNMNLIANAVNKTTEAIIILKQRIGARLFIVFISIVVVTGCIHNKDNSCFEAFGGSILWNRYLSIKFDDKFKQNGSPTCTRNENFSSFSLGIGILDKKIKREEGNSAIIQFNLTSFTKKLDVDQINGVVNSFSNKQLLEVESISKKNDARFSRVYSKIGPLTKDKYKICRVVVTSIIDYKAKNMPFDHQYLLQNDIYKTCFFRNYNQVIVLSASYRIIPDLEKIFWPRDVIDNLNLWSFNIIMNDGKPLGDLIKIEEKEIYNLEFYDK